ncbi:MAG: beta-ketoacyl-ACP synthase II [Firmicutes bacterium]|nr:beta-ketoacyl-ACP synthase II [Bacillota bacterium]
MGVVTPIGTGKDSFCRSLQEGRSGTARIASFDPSLLSSQVAGEVRDFDPDAFFGPRERRRMERFVQFAVVAARMAVSDAGLELQRLDAERVGVHLGTGLGSFALTEREMRTFFEKGPGRVSPTYFATVLPNMASAQIATCLGAKGYLGTTLTTCAAGTQAVGEAAMVLRLGKADVMLAGGSEANVTPFSVAAFAAMKALSTANDQPARACRPFDRGRDGFVIAEGAAVFILETLAGARRRGARVYAELAGFGSKADAYHATSPAPDARGMRAAMEEAMREAGVSPEQIDYINAHGTGTVLNDHLETLAIKKALGVSAYRVPVSSTKSMTGHTLAAAGAVELAATLVAMERDFIPPTINYVNPDPECDLDYVPNEARRARIDVALSNSFGFGGQNACVVLRRV